MTKREHIEAAALEARVIARRRGEVIDIEMAWSAIAIYSAGDFAGPPLSPQDVLRAARRELRANEEWNLL